MYSEVAQSCLTLCDRRDGSLPGFTIHGIFRARILEWAAISFSNMSSYFPCFAPSISCPVIMNFLEFPEFIMLSMSGLLLIILLLPRMLFLYGFLGSTSSMKLFLALSYSSESTENILLECYCILHLSPHSFW